MDTNTFFKTVLIVLAIVLVLRYRCELFGLYVDLVEPKSDADLPTEYLGVSESHDYASIKKLIASSKTHQELGTCFTLIEMFQDEYAGFSALLKVDKMITLYQEKQAMISSVSPAAIE